MVRAYLWLPLSVAASELDLVGNGEAKISMNGASLTASCAGWSASVLYIEATPSWEEKLGRFAPGVPYPYQQQLAFRARLAGVPRSCHAAKSLESPCIPSSEEPGFPSLWHCDYFQSSTRTHTEVGSPTYSVLRDRDDSDKIIGTPLSAARPRRAIPPRPLRRHPTHA